MAGMRATPRSRVLAQTSERGVEADTVEIELEGADVGADGHLVVVEDHDQGRAQVPGLVHRLEGDAAGQRPVAEHADDVAVRHTGELGGLDEPQPVADGRRRVAGTDDVVRRLAAIGKAGDPPVLADGAERVTAAGEQLVGVALVTHVPDDLVVRALQHAVQRHGELHGAKAGGEMAADLADARQNRLAHFPRKERQLALGELLEVGGVGDLVQIPHRRTSIAPGPADGRPLCVSAGGGGCTRSGR